MSQFLVSALGSQKTYLIPNQEMSSSHSSMFWSPRRYSDSSISWSYPPPKNNLCTKLLSHLSSKFVSFNTNLCNSCPRNCLRVRADSSLDELVSQQVIRRMAVKTAFPMTDSILSSDVCSDCEVMSDNTFEEHKSVDTMADDMSIDSDSSGDRTARMQSINDSRVLDSMQNDRQKRIKRKRRRRKKKSVKTTDSTDSSPKKCFIGKNEFISFLLDTESDYETESSDEIDVDSNQMSLCLDLKVMCEHLLVDYFIGKQTTTSNDETHCYPKPSETSYFADEKSELLAIHESVCLANQKWNQSYGKELAEERKQTKVNFSPNKPLIRVLCVWDYASRQARSGGWEQMAVDRQRFAEKCRRIETQIGFVFNAEHRQRIFKSRFI
ncbi:uncharacterized protein LOC128952387 [Oppia nitens]|uniref:uncharacterized protein LOC128952387 n=1 Tax=Oppia nitens TaxID=1686743 RepID=UPI0023DB5F6D|nr:uncharacterized protein LOC128952387 [Oppia nitens]